MIAQNIFIIYVYCFIRTFLMEILTKIYSSLIYFILQFSVNYYNVVKICTIFYLILKKVENKNFYF